VPNNDVSKDVLNVVKKKTGKSISQSDIYKLASGVKPSTMQSEAQLRQLIKQVAALVNAPVSEATTNEIVKAIKSSNMNVSNLEQMIQVMLGKK
jgi:hypothetical protein